MSIKGTIVGALACQKNSYLKSFESIVLKCTPVEVKEDKKKKKKASNEAPAEVQPLYEVELEDTILFPEGGGQPGDKGLLITPEDDKINVLDVQRKNLRAIHIVDKPIKENLKVRIELDWKRRLDHMQQHSGQHLLSAILDKYDLDTMSWNMGDMINYIEIKRKLTNEEIENVMNEFNQLVFENLKVDVELPQTDSHDEEKGIMRVIKIGDLDRNPCCGTHLSNIGELKGLSILGQMNGKNGSSKINFVVGDRVFKYTRELYDTSKKLMATLNSNFEDLTVKADQIVAQQKKNQSLVKNLKKEIATIKSAEILQKINEKGKGKSYYVYREEGDLEFINKIYSDVKDTIDATESTLVLIAGTEKESAVVACGYNIATVVEELKKRVPLLKGGGKLVFPGGKYQGRAVLGRGELKHVLEYLESL